MAKKSPPAKRLPSGLFAYRGKARHFGALPKAEQHRFRVAWRAKGEKTWREKIAPLKVAQKEAQEAYKRGDSKPGHSLWEKREEYREKLKGRFSERLFYYHKKKGK